MSGIDYANLNVALDLFKLNFDELERAARASVTDFELEYHEVVLICAVYNEDWKEFVDGLNPEAAEQAAYLRANGLNPVSISATTQYQFVSYLREMQVDIPLPEKGPDKDNVWLVVLHELGHTWFQLTITDPRQMAS